MIFFIAVIATLNLVLGYFLAVYLGLAEPKRPTGVDAATADAVAEEIPDRAAPVAGSPVAATSTIEQRKVEKPAASFVDAQKIPAEPSASVDAASQPIAGNPEESGANDEADLLAGIESFRAQLAETNPASTDESETAAEVRDPPVDAEAKLPGAKPAPAEEPEPADTSQDAEDVLDDGPPGELAIVATEVQPSAIAEKAEEEAVESLYALSLELSRALDETMPVPLVRRYLKGEKDLFARRLAEGDRASIIARMKLKYEGDDSFKSHADRYLTAFDALMTSPASAEGQVYLMLRQAAGHVF